MKTHYGLYENAESAIRTAYLKLKRIDCPEKEETSPCKKGRERERERGRYILRSPALYRFCQRNLSRGTSQAT